jgi:aerobic C4-dicarboxylate transport protein
LQGKVVWLELKLGKARAEGHAILPGTLLRGGLQSQPRRGDVSFSEVKMDAPPRHIFGHLYVQVLAAIIVGALIGHFYPAVGEALRPLGDGFIKLVKMVIAPIIFLTVVTGIAAMSEINAVGRVIGKAMLYFVTVSTTALLIGLLVGNVIQPGAGMHVDPATLDASSVSEFISKSHDQTVLSFIMNIVPTTLLGGLANGDILQTLFAAILLAVTIIIVGPPAWPVVEILNSASEIVFRLVGLLMKFAPIGALGAIAFTIGRYGIGSIVNLASLVATFYLTSAFFVVVVLGLIARLSGFSIFRLMRYLEAELFLVLGTSSSEAAMPSLIEKLEKAGAAKSVVGVVVPTGYSFNLDGTNIYMTMAILFIAQATGVHLSYGDQFFLLGVAMLSSKGAAGVSGAGFITLAATLAILPKVPLAGIALILGVDRFMSECRSLTNFIGNAVATLVVARWEGALDQDVLDLALGSKSQIAVVDEQKILEKVSL